MIMRERRGRDAPRVLGYVLRSAKPRGDRETVVDVRILNSGCGAVGTVSVAAARAMVEAAAASRPELLHRVLHLVLAPDPSEACRTTVPDTRRQCMRTLHHAMARVGLADRVALVAFHARPNEAGHLHAVIALPHPETGRSIAQHRLRERLRAAVQEAVDAMRIERNSPEEPSPITEPAPRRDELLPSPQPTPPPRPPRGTLSPRPQALRRVRRRDDWER